MKLAITEDIYNMKILGNIPKTHFHVACSGGSDSMVLVDFLRKYPQNKFDILYFDHGTECCLEAKEFLIEFCKTNNIIIHLGKISRTRNSDESQEEYWRKERYAFLSKFSDEPILMAHHLNDAIETWIMTSMQGNPQVIPYHNKKYNIYRPMLCVPKSEINAWIKRHEVKHVYDRSNSDITLKRNYIRHKMISDVYQISPGIEKIISKKILKMFNDSLQENLI